MRKRNRKNICIAVFMLHFVVDPNFDPGNRDHLSRTRFEQRWRIDMNLGRIGST